MDTHFDFIAMSKCYTCKHRFTRIIKPMIEDISELVDLEGDEDLSTIKFENNVCLVLNTDIDCLVLKCNHYSNKNNTDKFFNNPFVDS